MMIHFVYMCTIVIYTNESIAYLRDSCIYIYEEAQTQQYTHAHVYTHTYMHVTRIQLLLIGHFVDPNEIRCYIRKIRCT